MGKGKQIPYACPRHPNISLKGKNAKCEMVCGDLMQCGHKCQSKCHARRNEFHPPCKQLVEQDELCDHISERRCDQPFVCRQTVTITRECGHEVDVLCSNRRTTNCKSACGRKLNCGHICARLCYQPCLNACESCKARYIPRPNPWQTKENARRKKLAEEKARRELEQERIALELARTGKFHPPSSTAPSTFPQTIDSFFNCSRHSVKLLSMRSIVCCAESQQKFLEVVNEMEHSEREFIYVVLPFPLTFSDSRTEELLTNHVGLFGVLILNTVYQKCLVSSDEEISEMQVLIGKFHVGRAHNIKSNWKNVKLRKGFDCLFAEDTTAYTDWKKTAFLPVWFVTVRIEDKRRPALELARTGELCRPSNTAPSTLPQTIDSFFDCRQHTVELIGVSGIECSAESQQNFLKVVNENQYFGGEYFIYVVLPFPLTFSDSRKEQLLTKHVELFKDLGLNTVYRECPITSNEEIYYMTVLIGKFHVGRAQKIKSISQKKKYPRKGFDCLFAEDTTAYTKWKKNAFLPVWFVTVRIEDKLFAKPTYWIKENYNGEVKHPVQLEYNLLEKLQNFFLQQCRCGSGKDGNPRAFVNANTWKLFRIQNDELWKKYRRECQRLILKNGNTKVKSIEDSVGTFPTLDLLRNGLEVGGAPELSVNEVYLFHGTKEETAEIVCCEGFDHRIAKRRLFGEGTYFTNAPCKAAQYAKNRMFISRVLLGDIQFVQHFSRCIQPKPPHTSLSGYASLDKHREFIVFNRASTYPEYLLEFDSE